jgi:UDP-2,4-diacetamido-2,4,6-trideoxy-beta-L-altropyranose hydrolase
VSETLLIRADASPQIGIGHVMRCMALAEAWQAQGGEVVFASASAPQELEQRLDAEGFARRRILGRPGQPEEARETAALARNCSAACVVLDGYHFDPDYRRALGRTGARLLLVVDGVPPDTAGADFVLDQNLGASRPGGVREDSGTRFLLGPRYALLRREFWRWRGRKHPIAPTARKLLVTLGGSDPENMTLRILRALRTLPESRELEARIVVGPANRHRASLEKELIRAPETWRLLAAPDDMPELVAWADLGISAAGSTCWELAFMGLPFVTIVLADNQRSIAANLARAGVSRDLGWHEQVSAEGLIALVHELFDQAALRMEMGRLGQETVDGFGAERVASLLSAVAA